MVRSLAILWGTLLAAIVAMCVLAQFWVVQRKAMAEQRVREILASQLEPANDAIAKVIDGYSISLQDELGKRDLSSLDDCVDIKRFPLSDTVIVVDSDSILRFPENFAQVSTDRQTLIDEAVQLLREQVVVLPTSNSPAQVSTQQLQNSFANDAQGLQDVLEQFQQSDAAQQQNAKLYYGNRGDVAPRGRSSPSNTAQIPSQDIQQAQIGSVESEFASEFKAEPEQSQVLAAEDSLVEDNADRQDAVGEGETISAPEFASDFGWLTWYHRRGMVLGFWWNQENRWRGIVALPRARWMADIVAALPSTSTGWADSRFLKNSGSENSALAGSLKQLVDIEGAVIYQWGDASQALWEQAEAATPTAEISVAEPLEGWRLRVLASDQLKQRLAGDNLVLPIWLAVSGVSIALLLGGVIVTLNLNRQVRLAASRVSFVNQVSHELRTPLTNICMYADLLKNEMESAVTEGGQSERSLGKLEVIQNESQRLSRLINNVLQFARADRKKKLHRQMLVVDRLVEEALSTFRPRLDELQFDTTLSLNCPEPRRVDPDAVEQILVNLIGNAEKYASDGRRLTITTTGTDQRVEIEVRDAGPGVPASMKNRIFKPFERISDRLEDPAGTGIGLTIVRELSKQHGGDCRLIDSTDGAAFLVAIEAPLAANI